MPRSSTPPPPSLIWSTDRRTQELYIKFRALSALQTSYRRLLTMNDEEIENGRRTAEQNRLAGVSKRRRLQSAGSFNEVSGEAGLSGEIAPVHATASTSASAAAAASAVVNVTANDPSMPRLPRIDSSYRLELTAARPEAGVTVLGEPPADVYSVPGTGAAKRADNKAIITTLIDRACVPQPFIEQNITLSPPEQVTDKPLTKLSVRKEDISMLFYDLDNLSHYQVRSLAEFEWARQLPYPIGCVTAASQNQQGGSRMAIKRTYAQAQTATDEAEIDAEMEQIRRAFCDKTRAGALAARAGAGW